MTITVNMDKAREVARDIIRREREPIMQALDVEFMRAVEAGNKSVQKEVAAQKQVLRDAPTSSSISEAETPADLKTAISGLLSETSE